MLMLCRGPVMVCFTPSSNTVRTINLRSSNDCLACGTALYSKSTHTKITARLLFIASKREPTRPSLWLSPSPGFQVLGHTKQGRNAMGWGRGSNYAIPTARARAGQSTNGTGFRKVERLPYLQPSHAGISVDDVTVRFVFWPLERRANTCSINYGVSMCLLVSMIHSK